MAELRVILDGRQARREALATERSLRQLARQGPKVATASTAAGVGLDKQAVSTARLGAATATTTAATRTLTGAFSGLLVAGAGIAGISVGAAALGKGASAAKDFSLAIAEVTTLIDDSFGSVKTLREETRRLSREFGTTSVAQADALYSTISAGAKDATVAIDVLTSANILARGGVAELGTTINLLTTVLNSYGLEATEATKINDILFTAVRLGKTTIDELGASLGQITSIASSFGVSAEQLGASMAFLTKNGIQTTQAVTGFRALLISIASPSAEARTLANSLGIEWGLAAIKNKGFTATLRDAFNALGRNEDKFRRLVGSVEALSPALVFATDDSNDFNNILGEVTNSTGAAQTAADKLADSLGGRLQDAQSQINDSFQQLGTDVLPTLTGALEGVANNIDRIVSVAKTVGVGLAIFLGALALRPVLALAGGFRTLGKAVAAAQFTTISFLGEPTLIEAGILQRLSKTVSAVAVSFRRFAKALRLSPAGLAITILGALAFAIIKSGRAFEDTTLSAEKFDDLLNDNISTWGLWGAAGATAISGIRDGLVGLVDVIKTDLGQTLAGAQLLAFDVRRGASVLSRGISDTAYGQRINQGPQSPTSRSGRGSTGRGGRGTGGSTENAVNFLSLNEILTRANFDEQAAANAARIRTANETNLNIQLNSSRPRISRRGVENRLETEAETRAEFASRSNIATRRGGQSTGQFEGGADLLASLRSPEQQEISDLRRLITQVRNSPILSEGDRSEQLSALNQQLMDLEAPAQILEKINDEFEELSPLEEYAKSINDIQFSFESLAAQGIQSASDALADFFLNGKSGAESFANALRSIAQQLVSLTIQRALIGPVANLLPFADGGIFNGGRVQAFASGGVIDRPTFFSTSSGPAVAGEDGPEAIIPLRRGANGKLGVENFGGAGNGGLVFNSSITINVPANGNGQGGIDSDEIGRTVDGYVSVAVEKAFRKAKRSGGNLR